MVSDALSIGPLRSDRLPAALEIFDVDAGIAAEFAVGIARNADDSAESEIELSTRIETRHGGKIRPDRLDPDRSAVEPGKVDAARQFDAELPARLAPDHHFAGNGTGADRGDRAARDPRPVRREFGGALTGSGQDQAVEIEAGLYLELNRLGRRPFFRCRRWAAEPARRGSLLRQRRRSKARGAKQRASGKKGKTRAHDVADARQLVLKQG